MRLPDHMLRGVVYLGSRTRERGIQFGGTAFFVSFGHPLDAQRRYIYLVTAKHNIKRAHESAMDGVIVVRPRWTRAGDSDFIKTTRSQWIDHEDADVSICDVDFPWDRLDFAHIDEAMLMTDLIRDNNRIGPGDELQVVGLFTGHRGVRNNVPIVRSGVIAAMPDADEPVDTEEGPMVAYLAEIRSLGGLSGSPVFVVLPPFRFKEAAPSHEARAYLLGLVAGHWDRRVADDHIEGLEQEKIHQGIAVVVPTARILDLLNSSSEVEKRQASL